MEEQERGEEGVETAQELEQPEPNTAENDCQDTSQVLIMSGPQLGPCESSDAEPKPESHELPVTTQAQANSTSVQNPPTLAAPNQTEEFVIFDQNGQPLQCERMVIVTGQSENGQVYVIPSNHLGGAQVLLPHGQLLDIPVAETIGSGEERSSHEELQTVTLTAISDSTSHLALMTPPSVISTKSLSKSSPDSFVAPMKPLPSNAPSWALRLRNCEKIGDSYRGYCNTEAELEAVLLLHKQQTHAVFGTRQSPSPAKPATRLMWKSQYVPYDGIPFVNAGSRAIVMECQFGPRRKGLQPKKSAEQEITQNLNYKATCPARIYIKKIRKFPEYRVPTDPKVDKKVVRQEQEKAFFNLKKSLWDVGGVLRYYLQLPTQKAHLYHDVDSAVLLPPPDQLPFAEEQEIVEEEEEVGNLGEGEGGEDEPMDDGSCIPSRLHPLVAEKIRELVAQGHDQVYTVRKQLRKFVEREMFKSDEVPERHNLCYFPTVNDIKNHIHEAQKTFQQHVVECTTVASDTQWGMGSDNLLTETVTLTLTPASVEVSPHKGGVLEGSDTLSPEAVQLFSSLTSLQPKIFAQLQGIQLQPASCPAEGPLPHGQQPATTPSVPLCTAPELLDPSSPLQQQPLLLSPTQFLQSSASLGEGIALADPSALLGMAQLVRVSAVGDRGSEGEMAQILLEDGQTIPVQIVDPATIALTHPEDEVQVKEENEEKSRNCPLHSEAPGD